MGQKTDKEVFCENCGFGNSPSANFCKSCGEKLRDVCNCWIKKRPYKCGERVCPGFGLYARELRKSKP